MKSCDFWCFGRNLAHFGDLGSSEHLKRLVQNTLWRQGRKRGAISWNSVKLSDFLVISVKITEKHQFSPKFMELRPPGAPGRKSVFCTSLFRCSEVPGSLEWVKFRPKREIPRDSAKTATFRTFSRKSPRSRSVSLNSMKYRPPGAPCRQSVFCTSLFRCSEVPGSLKLENFRRKSGKRKDSVKKSTFRGKSLFQNFGKCPRP